jgi:hypothetical protein
MSNITIYALLCEDNKYYIGKSQNANVRILDHFINQGSAWTKKYKPLKIVETISNCDKFDEDKYVLIYMEKYGIDNVRGGVYSQIKLLEEQITSIKTHLTGANDLCFKCKQKGHFAKECKKVDDIDNDYELIVICYKCHRMGHYANQCYKLT